MSRFDTWVRSVGQDPDPRFTLANERTFLAWITTSLGLMGLGLAVGTLIPGDHFSLSVLAGLWVLLAVVDHDPGLVRWFRFERAMRLQRGPSAVPVDPDRGAEPGLLSRGHGAGAVLTAS